ncbi:hypothetical protein P8452_41955 [Trifolium repens]|nr:hypothetical protein P8452_41955 [Trifolium repens]
MILKNSFWHWRGKQNLALEISHHPSLFTLIILHLYLSPAILQFTDEPPFLQIRPEPPVLHLRQSQNHRSSPVHCSDHNLGAVSHEPFTITLTLFSGFVSYQMVRDAYDDKLLLRRFQRVPKSLKVLCWLNANCCCPLIDIISKYEDEKEKLFMRYEQLRKKKKSMMSEQVKACNDKITQLEGSLKKKKGIGLSSLSKDPNQAI